MMMKQKCFYQIDLLKVSVLSAVLKISMAMPAKSVEQLIHHLILKIQSRRRALFCIRPRRWVKGALAFLNVLPETGKTELFEVNSSGGFGIAP